MFLKWRCAQEARCNLMLLNINMYHWPRNCILQFFNVGKLQYFFLPFCDIQV